MLESCPDLKSHCLPCGAVLHSIDVDAMRMNPWCWLARFLRNAGSSHCNPVFDFLQNLNQVDRIAAWCAVVSGFAYVEQSLGGAGRKCRLSRRRVYRADGCPKT
jgi:hypothetical protein